jgi:hypothetical protein
MGFKSANDLRAANFKLDVYLNGGKTPSPITSDGKFTADKINSYTIDNLMAKFGGKERVPNAANSQKNFKILTVFMSRTDTVGQTTSTEHVRRVVDDINWFAEKTEYPGSGYYNFYQATGKVGSIEVGGAKKSVKTGIDMSNPDPNPAPQPKPKPEPAQLTVSPVSLNLAEGYGDTSFTVLISNTGGEKVELKGITVSGVNFTNKAQGGTWISQYSTQSSWKFAPVIGLAPGSYPATITVSFGGYEDLFAEIDFVVRESGAPSPLPGNLTIKPTVIDCPTNYGDTSVIIRITNEGEINAFIEKQGVSASDEGGKFAISYNSGCDVIAPNGENRTWILNVKSGLNDGNYSGEITIAYDNGKSAVGEILLNVGGDGSTPSGESKSQDKKYGVFFDKNPVSETTQIYLKTHEKAKSVKISIFDNSGNVVFAKQNQGVGKKKFIWDLTNLSGRKVASGTYLVLVECSDVDGKVHGYSAKIGVKR